MGRVRFSRAVGRVRSAGTMRAMRLVSAVCTIVSNDAVARCKLVVDFQAAAVARRRGHGGRRDVVATGREDAGGKCR